ncbi:MAG: anti-sigma factor [Janthinobacterium lividum]
MLAAEYVLGTLDADGRADVAARLPGDADLGRAVAAWEDRLAPLISTIRSVVPPAAVLDALMVRLFGDAGSAASAPAGTVPIELLRTQLRRWQVSTGGLALLAASLTAWVVVHEMTPGLPTGSHVTAVLQRDAGAPAMVLDIDLATRRLTITPVLDAAPSGRTYQLWIIDPALGNPRSLGLVAGGAGKQESLTSYDPAVISGATYAVSVEPAGGSPTGLPTSTPILTGKLAATRS